MPGRGGEQPAAGAGMGAPRSRRPTKSHLFPSATFYTNERKKKTTPKKTNKPTNQKTNQTKNQVKITLQGGKRLISWAGNIKEGQKGPPPLGQWVPRYGASRQFPTSSWMAKALRRAWGGQGHPAPTRLSLWALKHHSTPKVVVKGKST